MKPPKNVLAVILVAIVSMGIFSGCGDKPDRGNMTSMQISDNEQGYSMDYVRFEDPNDSSRNTYVACIWYNRGYPDAAMSCDLNEEDLEIPLVSDSEK